MQASPGVGKSMGTRKVLGNGDIRHGSEWILSVLPVLMQTNSA